MTNNLNIVTERVIEESGVVSRMVLLAEARGTVAFGTEGDGSFVAGVDLVMDCIKHMCQLPFVLNYIYLVLRGRVAREGSVERGRLTLRPEGPMAPFTWGIDLPLGRGSKPPVGFLH